MAVGTRPPTTSTMPISIASFNLGPPLTSPKLNAQFRNSLRSSQVRKWFPLMGSICVLLLIVQYGLLGGRSGEQQRAQAQAVQHIYINPPSLSYASDKAPSVRQASQRPRAEFPPKIWQTWKVDPLRFEERDLEKARSWTEKNPDWRYEVLTDGNDLRYVDYHYGPEGFNRPDIVAFYRDVTASIIKADLLRYLIMYAEGGVYADIDVEAMKPMSKFIPERYDHKDIDMVIGVEIDEPEWTDHPILGPKSQSFCQWTFMCKPQLPVMLLLVENIMNWLHTVAQNQTVPLGEVTLDFDEVISGTGPSAFTRAIISQMNADRAQLEVDDSGKPPPEITWSTFHDLDESKLVDRVLVLNVEAFAAGQGHSNSGTHDTRHSLVRHHYHASNWPSRHPRYRHPAYGQVEDCNWDRDCVHKWDESVAIFAKLPEDEQKRIIAEKDRERELEEAEEARRVEEEAARAREEDEARRKEEERARAEEDARRAKEEADRGKPESVNGVGKPQPPQPPPPPPPSPPSPGSSSFSHTLFGYSVFICAVFVLLRANGCISRRSGPQLPVTESKA